jgi:hypothetical protein
MYKFTDLVKSLVVELGPDTEDLKLRTGLHSGAVTAGVLRSQRARFQLFGDTVSVPPSIISVCINTYSPNTAYLVHALTPKVNTGTFSFF